MAKNLNDFVELLSEAVAGLKPNKLALLFIIGETIENVRLVNV